MCSGPSELHLLVGTNMCNSPNQDLFKPIKTGYMHKLGGQGMLKNWKKRWFVLKHDGCLYYYKTQEVCNSPTCPLYLCPFSDRLLHPFTLFSQEDRIFISLIFSLLMLFE